ncbi:MAG: hypothetical protein IJ620_05215 [Bacteroidales bacterium]|nr:hypothetical protein [Bacteroidales bacterium]
MIHYFKPKKKLIISYKNLSDDLKLLFKDAYPDGYKEYIQTIRKPNGEPLFVVPLETDDTSYLVKFDAKIDTLQAEDLEKDIFGTEDKSDDDYTPIDTIEKDEGMGNDHTERVLNHGAYESMMDEMNSDGKKKKTHNKLDDLRNELKEEFGDDDDEDEDEYSDTYKDEDTDDEDDFEPSEEDLAAVEEEFLNDPTTALAEPKGKKKTAAKTATKKTAAKPSSKTASKTTSKSTAKTSAKTTSTKTKRSSKSE